jgi:RNA polymerase sigma-54 factor
MRIAELVRGEDSHDPMSDQKIVEILNRDGLNIARRTVAKYREQLQILPARMRKKF